MKQEEFITHVQSAAQLDSRQEAERAVQATLETLAERLVGGEAENLAAQLPKELGSYLEGHAGEPGGTFGLQEFYQRVGDREGISPVDAAIHVRAVMSVLRMAATPGEFNDIEANFPHEYNELFAPHR